MAAENSIEQSFKRWCKANGYYCVKLKLNPGRGWPDRGVLLPDNRMCWIEFKGSQGKVSAQQDFIFDKMRSQGHDVFVCDSLESAQNAITQLSRGNKRLHRKPMVKKARFGSMA